LDGIQQVTDSAAFTWKLMMCHTLCSCLHGDEGVAMPGNELLEKKIAPPFPLSSTEQLFVPFDLCFPFVSSSVLVRQGKPGIPSILASLT